MDPSENVQKKIKEKLPKFILAFKTLKEQKKTLIFHENKKNDFFDFNKTNDQTKFLSERNIQILQRNSIGDNNINSVHFQKSLKSLFDSLKTDNFSKNEKNLMKELKQISLFNNEEIFNEKLYEIVNFIKFIE